MQKPIGLRQADESCLAHVLDPFGASRAQAFTVDATPPSTTT